MERFTISNIENLSGIKSHTLRIWEKRYGILLPKRKESNHRLYDNDDLKYILQVAYLYHKGYKISKIANLSDAALKELTAKVKTSANEQSRLVNKLLEASATFDEVSFDDIVTTAIERFGFEESMIHLVYPYLEKVGLQWMNDATIPAHEHFASNIIRSRMIVEIDKLNAVEKRPGSILLFTPPGEYHEIPLLFTHYLLKKHGKHVIYLGANISLETLKIIYSEKKPAQLFFHLITNFTKYSEDEYLNELSKTFSPASIIMSGPLTARVNKVPAHCTVLRSLEEMLEFTKK